LYSFLRGDKALLGHRRAVMHLKLTVDQKILLEVPWVVNLTETDALVRENLIAEIDSVTEDLYKFLSQELYEGLVGLQVFATDLNDTAVQDMMKIICCCFRYLEMTEEDLDKSKVFKEAAEKLL
jgi:hypothetical protein